MVEKANADIEKLRPAPGEVVPSAQLLIADLERHRTPQNSAKLDAMIEKARQCQYHDLLEDFGLTELIKDIKDAGLSYELIENVVTGKYDETREV